jgi:putative methyltransferase
MKKKLPPDKTTYATVCKTIQHIPIINMILDNTTTPHNNNLRKAIGFDSIRNKGLLYIMLYELLFGPYMSIRGGGKIKRMIIKYENELRMEANKCLTTTSVGHNLMDNNNGNRSIDFPRYVRVNTLRSTVVDVVNILSRELKTRHATIEEEVTDDSTKKNTSTTVVSEISDIYVDAHVPNLLVLPPTASSWLHHDYELVQSGKIVLQDKSSCFSALVLMNGVGEGRLAKNDDDKSIPPCFDYIDACSAPGNKTSHLAALVHNSSIIINGCGGADDDDTLQRKQKKKKGKTRITPKSTIFAFERSSTRFTTLKERMKQLIPSSSNDNSSNTNVVVDPIHGDFLKADPTDPKFNNVRSIMLDPSCSGSGIVNSPDRWMDDNTATNDDNDNNNNNNKDVKRIQSLSNFQLVALKHAMSFPNVTQIVYSTCSIHDNENEIVIATALREVTKSNDDDGNDWEIMAPTCLEHWPRRGHEVGGLTACQADCLIRCDGLDGDETNGFFVAFLVRRKKLILDAAAAAAGHTTTTTLRTKGIDYPSVSIPTYNGQFVDLCKRSSRTNVLPAFVAVSDTPKQSLSSSNNHESSELTKLTLVSPGGKKKQQHDNNNKLSCTKSNTKSAKKREKKMAWKRNQALLKSSRLKKKEGGGSSSSTNCKTLKDA